MKKNISLFQPTTNSETPTASSSAPTTPSTSDYPYRLEKDHYGMMISLFRSESASLSESISLTPTLAQKQSSTTSEPILAEPREMYKKRDDKEPSQGPAKSRVMYARA